MASCRECKLFDLDACKDRAGRVRKDRSGRCLWISTEVWPDSVLSSFNPRPTTGWCQPDDGHRCKRFIKRES